MIRLIFCDTEALSYDAALRAAENIPMPKDVIECKDKGHACESIASYILLYHALTTLYGIKYTEVKRGECGKPYIDGSTVNFSISHRAGVALVAFSDEGEIGADIELCLSEDRMKRISKRYLEVLDFTAISTLDAKVYCSSLSGDGEVENLANIADVDNNNLHYNTILANKSTYTRWTMLEAVLKLDGGGFGSLGKAGELLAASQIHTAIVKYHGRSYAISAAIRA